MKKMCTLLSLTLLCVKAYAVDFSPYPGNFSVCPDYLIIYSITQSDCNNYTWTITNGTFVGGSTGSSVTVQWNNVAAIGKLKVKSTCGSTNYENEKSYVIRSLTGQNPANPRAYQTLPYCSTGSINVAVDDMTVPNTGGTSSVNLEYVDGYEWVVPSGWTLNGSTGTVRTVESFATLTPTNGCVGGTLTVKAFVGPCGLDRKYSNSASINVNRTGQFTMDAEPGYNKVAGCGKINPVTFTAGYSSSLACASNYVWNFPSGWKGPGNTSSPVQTPTNSITLTPSGTSIDAGDVTLSTINLDCGSIATNKTVHISYGEPHPFMTGPLVICSGEQYSVSGLPPATSIVWSSSNPNGINIDPTTGYASRVGYFNDMVTLTATLTGPCPLNPVGGYVWAGPATGIENFENSIPGYYSNSEYYKFRITPMVPGTEVSFFTGSWSVTNGYFTNNPSDYAWIQFTGFNSTAVITTTPSPLCEGGDLSLTVQVGQGGCPEGDICPNVIYPNPASESFAVSVNEQSNKNKSPIQAMLYNSKSELVYEGVLSKKELRISVLNLPNGVYYLHLKRGEKAVQKRVVIKH